MKIHRIIFGLLFCFLLGSVWGQENGIKSNTAKETNYADKVATLLASETFEFIANTVYPASGAPKNLVGSEYFVSFSPERIISNLPFYGRAYRGMKMGRDKGMRFQGKPENFEIEKKKEYQVNAVVKDGDTYEISLSVGASGYAMLTISTNNRGTIRYQGEVVTAQ